MDVGREALPPQPTDHHETQINETLPTRTSSFLSVGSRNHDQLASHRHRQIHDLSSTFSSFSSSFNYSPPMNARPKRRCVFNSCHRGEVGGRHNTDCNSPPNQTQTQNNNKPVLPPIIKLFREQELAKLMFLLIVPIIAAVINLYNQLGHLLPLVILHIILGLILLGILFIWNGLLLEETYPRISVAAELLGSSSVILALVLLVACAVPGVTLPWLLAGFLCSVYAWVLSSLLSAISRIRLLRFVVY